jgi:hypothetical protein
MLIEPTPAIPPASGRRARLVVGAAAPVLLLVAVIGVGALGARDDDATSGPEATRAPAGVRSSPTAPEPEPSGLARPPAFPGRVLGLRTRTVADALERRRSGAIGDEIVAVQGFATVHPSPTECFVVDDAPTIADALACRREVIIADGPETFLAWSDGEVDWVMSEGVTHLHAASFPVVSLVDLGAYAVAPPPTSSPTGDEPVIAAIPSVPVVVLGRFDDPRVADPRSSARHPNEAFVIERIVWVDDVWQARPTVRFVRAVDGEIAIGQVRATTSSALPSGTVILSHSIADLEVLARLDPTAAGLVRSGADRLGIAEPTAVWYVRVMIRGAPPVDTLAGDTTPRHLAFAVMTADGTLLGTGTED